MLEPEDTRAKITMVGVGPGDPELVTLKARHTIAEADVVAGFASTLKVIEHLIRGQAITLSYSDQDSRLIGLVNLAKRGLRCVVCVWGDTTLSEAQFVGRFPRTVELEFINGISCIQVACCRLGVSLDESVVVSLHKRGALSQELDEIIHFVGSTRRTVLVLPRPWDMMPRELAGYLLTRGLDQAIQVTVMQNLTLHNELMGSFTLGELSKSSEAFSDLTVLALRRR